MLVPGRTSAYEPRNDSAGGARWRVSIPNFDTYGATSLYTTVGDLLKWTANTERPVVGDARMYARMETPTPLTTGDTSTYGLGVAMGTYRGARIVEHGGADAGYRSHLGRYPGKDLSIAIACNAATANTTRLARGVADAFIGGSLAPAEPTVAAQGVAVAADRLQRRVGVYVQPTTLQIVRLVMRGDRLAFENGSALVPRSENRFTIEGQNVEIVFADAERAGFERRVPGSRPVPYLWQQTVTPTAALLAPYAGEYVSAELGGAVYRVTASDTTLALRTGTEEPFTIRAMFADTFIGEGYTVQFIRARGRVTGFEATNGRMRRVKFARRAP
jgi:hypothetical protein